MPQSPSKALVGQTDMTKLSSQQKGTDKSKFCRQAGRQVGLLSVLTARQSRVAVESIWLFNPSLHKGLQPNSQGIGEDHKGMLGLGHPAFRMANHKAGAGLPRLRPGSDILFSGPVASHDCLPPTPLLITWGGAGASQRSDMAFPKLHTG